MNSSTASTDGFIEDPLTGEPMFFEDFPEHDPEREAEFLASREKEPTEPRGDDGPPTSDELEAKCSDLLTHPNILSVVDETLTASGFAGPTQPVKLIFLGLISRHLSKPVSIVLRGESASGKSYAIKRSLELVADSAYHALTSMSSKALFYDTTDLSHKILVVFEAEGLRNDVVTQALRTLLSEGRLEYQYTDFDSKTAPKVSREGPTGLLTSTAGRIDYELGTRVFSVPVADSEEMTKAILFAAAQRANGTLNEADTSVFKAMDGWIGLNRKPVVVPFAEDLAQATDARAVRMRRDFESVLGLVKAHALLHQKNREVDAHGNVVATVSDYEAVFGLVSELVSYSSGESVPPEIRETVDAVLAHTLHGAEPGISVAKLAVELGVHRTTVKRRLNRAQSLGYVVVAQQGRGQVTTYRWGENMPGDTSVLPDPAKLGKQA